MEWFQVALEDSGVEHSGCILDRLFHRRALLGSGVKYCAKLEVVFFHAVLLATEWHVDTPFRCVGGLYQDLCKVENCRLNCLPHLSQ